MNTNMKAFLLVSCVLITGILTWGVVETHNRSVECGQKGGVLVIGHYDFGTCVKPVP